jgi:hydroxyacylglutathione hydrolase
MRVVPVPCLSDNFAYLIHAEGSRRAAVVDPSEAAPVLAALEREGLELGAILNTHHHFDHVGGNEELRAKYPDVAVFGHASDRGRIPAQTEFLEEGNEIEVVGLRFSILHIPGHTTGAVAYVGHGAVFTGDTLFAGGCGRLFEGTPAMMYESLNVKLAALPDDTKVYFGHEYTQSNLRFAAHVEPSNPAVRAKAERVARQRDSGEHTTPSTMLEEKQTNPFMRVDQKEIIESVAARLDGDRSPAVVLGAVRAEKDAFR